MLDKCTSRERKRKRKKQGYQPEVDSPKERRDTVIKQPNKIQEEELSFRRVKS